jgi:hypothetical protein
MTQNDDTSDTSNRQTNTETVETSASVEVPPELLADAQERADALDVDLGEVLRNHVHVRLLFRDADGDLVAEW